MPEGAGPVIRQLDLVNDPDVVRIVVPAGVNPRGRVLVTNAPDRGFLTADTLGYAEHVAVSSFKIHLGVDRAGRSVVYQLAEPEPVLPASYTVVRVQ